ncbi:MAG: hypothetical protein JJE39_08450 [Vicinamibacteria bacterium]|nr:hypothetical protein [Vicinamibacteria bacterium]
MEITLAFTLVALASNFGQGITFQQTDLQFVSLERAERVANDIGKFRPDPKNAPPPFRPLAPEGKKFVVIRFSMLYAPPRNPFWHEAKILGTVPEMTEPQAFKCHTVTLWSGNGTWSVAFVFVIPDKVSLLSFHLEKDQFLDLSGMDKSAGIGIQ